MVRGLIERPTLDLDYFTIPGEEDAVTSLRDALERALDHAGLDHSRKRDLSTFVRVEVSDGDDRCEIDLAIDYRALPAEPSRYGPTLAVRELAANKVLALFDRAEARDFLDLVELTRHFELQSLIDLAGEKDAGFDTARFLESLASFDRFTPADLGVDATEYDRLSVDSGEMVRTTLAETSDGSHLTAASVSTGDRPGKVSNSRESSES